MKTTLRTTAIAIALGLFGLVGTAGAEQRQPAGTQRPAQTAQTRQGRQARQTAPTVRTPEQTKAALVEAAQRTGMPHFVTPGGKVVYNPHAQQHMHAVEAISTPGSGILQIFQFQGVSHTLGHFEGQYIHLQHLTGTNNWRMRPWTDRLRPSSSRMFGAMIQLSPTEAANMRTRLAGVFAEQGPEHAAGRQWENGHITDSMGARSFDCATGWCQMPVGQNGESVARLIGIPEWGSPYSLQRSLETGGNEKVVGVGLFGPVQPNLGQNPHETFVR